MHIKDTHTQRNLAKEQLLCYSLDDITAEAIINQYINTVDRWQRGAAAAGVTAGVFLCVYLNLSTALQTFDALTFILRLQYNTLM